jgi:KTSC domain
MPHVDSSVIEAVHYEPATAELTITFHSGRRYVYFAVPRGVSDALLAAPSIGGYFNAHIRDHFRYRRIA